MLYFLRKIKSYIPPIVYRAIIWVIAYGIVAPLSYLLFLLILCGVIELLTILNAPISVYIFLLLAVIIPLSYLKLRRIYLSIAKFFREHREMERRMAQIREQEEREKYWR